MKKNVLILASLFTSVLCLVGCNPMQNVKVEDVAKDLVSSSFEKTETRSKTVVDGLCMSIQEYTITDAAKHEITLFSYAYGDKVQAEETPVLMNYEMVGLAENNLGLNYNLIANGEKTPVLYWGNSLVIKGDTIGDAKAPIANLKKIGENFPNHEWKYVEEKLVILYDTIVKNDTTITSVKRPDPETGKPVVVKDTTVKVVTVINADTIGNEYEYTCVYTFGRDEKTLENTGKRVETFKWYEMNEEKTAMVAKNDSAAQMDFHWGISSMTSATRFVLLIENEKKEINTLSVANFSVDKKSCDFASKTYKLQ